jgi:hypothetical protein
MVSLLLPRRALEIQPYRVVGQRVIQNDGLILPSPTKLLAERATRRLVS